MKLPLVRKEGKFEQSQINIEAVEGLLLALSNKLDISSLSSNLTYYFTSADSGISGYKKLVEDTHDPDFSPEVEVFESSAIGGENVSIGTFTTTEGLRDLHLDNLTMTIVGAVRRASSDSANASVKFEVWVRKLDETEYKIGESGYSGNIGAVFHDIHLSAIIPHVDFKVGDRLVVKYFARRVGQGSNPKIRYRIGGDDPMRALLPMPITATLPDLAEVAYSGSYNDLKDKPQIGDSIEEAPLDNIPYNRKDGEWSPDGVYISEFEPDNPYEGMLWATPVEGDF